MVAFRTALLQGCVCQIRQTQSVKSKKSHNLDGLTQRLVSRSTRPKDEDVQSKGFIKAAKREGKRQLLQASPSTTSQGKRHEHIQGAVHIHTRRVLTANARQEWSAYLLSGSERRLFPQRSLEPHVKPLVMRMFRITVLT